MKDKIGFEIPSHLVETWKEADKIGRELCRDIQTIYQKDREETNGTRSDFRRGHTGHG